MQEMQEIRIWSWVRKIPWRRKWQPTPVFLPGKSHGQRSLVGYSPWYCKMMDTTKHTHTQDHVWGVCRILHVDLPSYPKKQQVGWCGRKGTDWPGRWSLPAINGWCELTFVTCFSGLPCSSAGKDSPCNAEDLGWENPLEKGKATHSSILAWRIPWMYSPWGRTPSFSL